MTHPTDAPKMATHDGGQLLEIESHIINLPAIILRHPNMPIAETLHAVRSER